MPVTANREPAYVALFDILGFSKLVERNELDRIADTYSRAKEVFLDILKHINAMNKGSKMDIEIQYRSFSDTFLIYTSKTGDDAFLSLLAACDGLFIGAIENKLLLRGVVTRGEIITQAGMEIGWPIVDAYRNQQKQEWSGCWISDECLLDFDATNYFEDKSLVQYEIPLKMGEVKRYVAFNNLWFGQLQLVYLKMGEVKRYVAFNWVKSLAWKAMYENKKNDFELKQIEDMLNFMNEQQADWAVRRKQHNTRKFVEYVLSPDFIMAYKKR